MTVFYLTNIVLLFVSLVKIRSVYMTIYAENQDIANSDITFLFLCLLMLHYSV